MPLIRFNPDRLQVQLLNTGLQNKDNPLYQLLFLMIGALNQLQAQINAITGGDVTNIINNTTVIQQMLGSPLGDDSSSGEDGFPGVQGIPGIPGENGPLMPYFIATGETLTVPLYKQGLFSVPIDNEGTIDVDGYLVEVN